MHSLPSSDTMEHLELAGEGPTGEQAGEQSAEARVEEQRAGMPRADGQRTGVPGVEGQGAGVPGADGSPQSLLRQEALGLWLRLGLL